MTKDEQRDYSRGYAAGRKRSAEETKSFQAEMTEMQAMYQKNISRSTQRRDSFFCAALTGILMRGTWTIGEKHGMAEQVQIAHQFADEAMKRKP